MKLDCMKLPKIAQNCPKLPEIARTLQQLWPQIAKKSAKNSQHWRQIKIATYFHRSTSPLFGLECALPDAARSFLGADRLLFVRLLGSQARLPTKRKWKRCIPFRTSCRNASPCPIPHTHIPLKHGNMESASFIQQAQFSSVKIFIVQNGKYIS